MPDPCVSEDHVRVKILESEKSCRDESDKRYAPSHVKTIVYAILVTAASGVILGTLQSFTGAFIKTYAPAAQSQAYDDPQ